MVADCRPGNTVERMRRAVIASLLVPIVAASLPACSAGGASYQVGDTGPAGGVVFYVSSEPFACGPDLATTCTYLEAAPAESDALRVWAEKPYENEENTGADRSAIGAGWANTLDIVAQGNTDPMTSAAAYADAYEFGGFDDWYLPAKDELHELYEQRVTTEAGSPNYWTSSDYDLNTVWNQSFMAGPQHRRLKFDQVSVRPVRAFP
jgi:hypothetical protein